MSAKKRRLRLRKNPARPAAKPPAAAPVAAFRTRGARLLYWGVFLVATVGLARVIRWARVVLGEGAEPLAWLALWGWLAVLLGGLFVLGLFLYERERSRGKVRQPVRVYERLLARWEAGER